jgi:hypothetical protein
VSVVARRRTVEERLKILEDIEAIKRLKHEYCFALDRRDWSSVAELFAREGVVDYGPIGNAKGRKAIRKLFVERISRSFTFFAHMAHNPIIDVKGDRATGKWYFDIPSTVAPRRARWIAGWYEDEYIREDGDWRFAHVKSFYFYISSYEKGWGKERFIEG